MEAIKHKVLVVDDDADYLAELSDLLGEGPYQVVTCSDSTQTFLLIKEHAPDRIVLDVAMPYLDGKSLLLMIRKRFPEIPVLICTGVPNVDAQGFLMAGAKEVIQKPFLPQMLFEALDRAA